MSTRREPRVAQNVRVWVSGRDSRGHGFRQTAKLTDASWLGGRLAEIRCLQAPGQVLEVRHRGKNQTFSVVWIDEASGLAGIRSLNPAESIFGVASGPPDAAIPLKRKRTADLPAPTPSRTPIEPTRRYKRHHCQGGAEVRTRAIDQPLQRVWATLDDLSLGGCHIKTTQPLPVNTSVEVRLGVGESELHAKGLVCSSRPGIGMGVAFLDLDAETRGRLEHLAEHLERENAERSLFRSRTQSA